MFQLAPDDRRVVDDLAKRHGFSPEAVGSMWHAVIAGRGGMAQFNHAEFGGSGQWMRGGMTMISDMFNDTLKSRVVALCNDLARVAADRPDPTPTGHVASDTRPTSGVREGGDGGRWWPGEFGAPNSTGAQNGARYAYFADARRLAIERGGVVTVYDTQDHQIGGVSQQQSRDSTLTFTSQHGPIDIDQLPVVS